MKQTRFSYGRCALGALVLLVVWGGCLHSEAITCEEQLVILQQKKTTTNAQLEEFSAIDDSYIASIYATYLEIISIEALAAKLEAPMQNNSGILGNYDARDALIRSKMASLDDKIQNASLQIVNLTKPMYEYLTELWISDSAMLAKLSLSNSTQQSVNNSAQSIEAQTGIDEETINTQLGKTGTRINSLNETNTEISRKLDVFSLNLTHIKAGITSFETWDSTFATTLNELGANISGLWATKYITYANGSATYKDLKARLDVLDVAFTSVLQMVNTLLLNRNGVSNNQTSSEGVLAGRNQTRLIEITTKVPSEFGVFRFYNITQIYELPVTNLTTAASSYRVSHVAELLTSLSLNAASAFVLFGLLGSMIVESAYSCEKAVGAYWIKGYLVVGIAVVIFYLIGYSLSYDTTSAWFGSDNTLLSEQIDFCRFGVYLSLALSLMWTSSSSWNGRASDASLTMNAVVVVTTVFPLLAHAMWAPNGWLMKHDGMDAMGVSIVHISGGVIGTIGCFFMGPRSGRFDADGALIPKPPFSPRNVGLGNLIVVLSYFSRCVFSMLLAVDISAGISDAGSLLFKSVANVLFSMLGTWTCVFFMKRIPSLRQQLQRLRGGSLLRFLIFRSGFLAVGAAPHLYDTWAACASGIVSGIIFCLGDLSLSLRIDDSLGVASVDLLNGVWGVVSVGFFSNGFRVCPMDEERLGLFFGGGWGFLWDQILVCTACILVGGVCSWICFRLVLPMLGGARLSMEEEFMGVDQDGLFHRLLRRGKRRKAESARGVSTGTKVKPKVTFK